MYKPNYKITPIITKYIGQISSAREVILSSPDKPLSSLDVDRREPFIKRTNRSYKFQEEKLRREDRIIELKNEVKELKRRLGEA